MTKTNTRSRKNATSNNGGRMTKVDGQTASVAPEGNTVSLDDQNTDNADATTQSADPVVEPSDESLPDGTTETGDPAVESPAEAPAAEVTDPVAEQPAAEPVDPFAHLPLTTIGDYEFRDFTDAATSDPRKYEAVQKAAVEAKLPVKKNWKHSADMIAGGAVKKEFKAGSVYGTIDQLVRANGRAGIPAYLLVAKVRQAQIGNKRSHYCTQLPPIGWAEGWIDTYVSKGFGKVMATKAPALTAEVVAEVKADDAAAESEAAQVAAAA